jgi:sirohydrochlorin cobaltochelatase
LSSEQLRNPSLLQTLGGKGPSKMMETTAIMICAHGNHDDSVVDEFNKLAKNMRERFPKYDVGTGFLGSTRRVLRAEIEKLIERGAKKIIFLPSMLFDSRYMENNLSYEINNFASFHPNIEFICIHELAIDPKLLTAIRDRIEECEAAALTSIDRKETLLMVVGRGTNDADANSNVHKVARMLWEGLGFGWAEVSYSSGAYPLVNEGMTHAMKLGYKRIIVFPYFLFTGTLVHSIYAWANAAQKANPDVEVLNAPHLNDHTQLIDCFVDSIDVALVGSNAMNCLSCKYREQVINDKGDMGSSHVEYSHHVLSTSANGDSAHVQGFDNEHRHED